MIRPALLAPLHLTLAGFLLALLPACAAPRTTAAAPVPRAASEAMAEAQAELRAALPDSPARARDALERAVSIAPDWVAPRRALDEILRVDLRALDALAGYRAALAAGLGDASTLYLAGRLEGRDGYVRFERALTFDATLAWAWHGMAFAAAAQGDMAAARRAAARALSLARDPYERTFFTATLARFEVASGWREEARERLDARAEDPETAPGDRTALAVQATMLLLLSPGIDAEAEANERALALLRSSDPTNAEIADLVAVLRRLTPDGDTGRIVLALAARPGAVRDRLRAELLLDEAPSPLALGLLERGLSAAGVTPPSGALVRAARFAAGDCRGAAERWMADLPSAARGPDGRPADPRLARAADLACELPENARAQELSELGDALVAAGWFREARSVAARLAFVDLDAAAELDARALSGLTFLSGTRRTLDRVDAEMARPRQRIPRPRERTDASGSAHASMAARARAPAQIPRTLDDLLGALAPHAAEARAFLGGDTDLDRVRAELVASPRRSYAGLAHVVHPGPRLSAEDEDAGLGAAGTPVGGLSQLLAGLGRFGLFGQLSGDAPDGTVLPLLALEERSGEHLGVSWRGTVAWCEGADVPSRAGRMGARIAGAALHEGYWIDVDQVRSEVASWAELARSFTGLPERVRLALGVQGLAVTAGESGRRERTATSSLLDQAERVRLAVLHDRAPRGEHAAGELGRVDLDELLSTSGAHEEGHLCDRTRFLPLSRKWPRALALLLDCGFSPRRVQEELEYRAQLTAIAAVADPRVPLAQVLDGVEGGTSVTPHAAGYARLLDDLVLMLDDEMTRGAFPSIARDRTLVHQLHRLTPEEVRTLAVALAKRKRLY